MMMETNDEVFQPEDQNEDREGEPEVVPAPAPGELDDVAAAPVKRGRGRPRKGELAEGLKERHASGKRGLAFDSRWLGRFRELCGQLPKTQLYSEITYNIEMLQRSVSYGLTSIQSMGLVEVTEIHDAQWNLGFSLADRPGARRTKTHFPLFADAGCTRLIELLTKNNIENEELLTLVAETLRKVLRWADDNPQHFDFRPEIEAAVARLAAGSNLYEPPAAPTRPVGRPPRAPITAPEPQEGVNFHTGQSAVNWSRQSGLQEVDDRIREDDLARMRRMFPKFNEE
jgi:hypothetical protein